MKLKYWLFVLLPFWGCSNIDYGYVKTKMWQWDKGYKIGEGDFFDFKNDCVLKNDTIFRNNQPVAILKYLNKFSGELKLASVDEKQTGVYINSDEFTK